MWKRAPSFFDVFLTTGTGSNQTLNHNLGVKPELIIRKKRNAADGWEVAANITSSGYDLLYLNTTGAATAVTWPNNGLLSAEPTSTSLTALASSHNFINYLFATAAGVSKISSYTGDGTAGKVIDCGFAARFVLIKKTSGTGGWFVYDTERGIVAGNDPYLHLNTNNAQNDQTDSIDPNSSGFAVNYSNTNANGQTYIFYAIA